jgi:hypothetical protein
LPEFLREHVELADDLRQLPVALDVEGEGNLVVAGLLRLDDVLVIKRGARMCFLLFIEREDDVLRRDRGAVVETSLGVDAEGHRRIVRWIGDPFGDEAVLGRRLVGACR